MAASRHAHKKTRGSPLTATISRTLHAPASRRAGRAGKRKEGYHLRPESGGRSTRRRHDAPETARGSPLTSRISRTLHAPSSRRAENSERVATYVQNFEDAPRASVTTRRPTDRPTDRPSPFYTKGKESVAEQSLTATPRQPRLGKKNTGS